MPNILVIGSSNTDMVVKTERFPQPGETLLGGDFFMFPGGKGANQAVAAARMGAEVRFITKTGNDLFGRQAIEGYQKEGILTDYCFTDPERASGVALITVNAHGENEIVVASGANATLSEADLTTALPAFEAADIVLIQLEIPLKTVQFAVQLAKSLGKRVILNPAPAQELHPAIFDQLFLITPNETEAELLTGIPAHSDAELPLIAAALHEKGVQHVLITLGARGAYLHHRDFAGIIPAQKVEAVDTTAAGDVFNGCLAVFLAEDQDWLSAIDLANRAAGISVTRMGAQTSAPHRMDGWTV